MTDNIDNARAVSGLLIARDFVPESYAAILIPRMAHNNPVRPFRFSL
jgi:hypothetical protein